MNAKEPLKRRPRIHHVATSFDGSIGVVAEFERHVQAWDLALQRRIAAFETTLDGGGRRLAVSRDGKHCAVGAYHVHGVALYDTATGDEIWRRKDLKKVQVVRFSQDDAWVMCGFEGSSFEVLRREAGKSAPSMRAVADLFDSAYQPVYVLEKKSKDFELFLRPKKRISKLSRQSFGTLAHAYGLESFCLSEAGSSIRCFDTKAGEERWVYRPDKGSHALHLQFAEEANAVVAVVWEYEEGRFNRLIALDADNGRPRFSQDIPCSSDYAGFNHGASVLSADGQVYASRTGSVVASLDFFDNQFCRDNAIDPLELDNEDD